MIKLNFATVCFMVICLLGLTSCGNDDDDDSSNTGIIMEQQKDDQGTYRATVWPLNISGTNNTMGTFIIKVEGDTFSVESNIEQSPILVKHLQSISVNGKCPPFSSDTNGDGYTDMAEILGSTGSSLIPLDNDLSEQFEGINFGPISNSVGAYIYRRSTSLSQILADLKAPDPDPSDLIVKLNPEEILDLSQRVIIIHGVPDNFNLPNTVSRIGDLSREESLPIACGEIFSVESVN